MIVFVAIYVAICEFFDISWAFTMNIYVFEQESEHA